MATDFFQRQAVARRNTAWLVFLFSVALVAIVGAVTGVAWYAADELPIGRGAYVEGREPVFPWEIPLTAGVVTLVLIVGGSWYKIAVLRSGGGTSVAESLGGKRLYPNSGGMTERRLLNVVEEMALASGTPVPPVYLMEESGINAFAAGFSPSDAVVGVTRGCAETLSRDELQGVIAHEFSHILNGDMRMSIRLIGILHGILLLGLIGHAMLRFFFYSGSSSSRSRDNSGDGKGGGLVLALLAISVALIVIGSIGSLAGGLIKAAVSRQREYLADASAVQFTRNPGGIAGALKRIGATVLGSRIKHPRAAEVSHMYFATGVWEGFTSLMATHPPLAKRIKAVQPNWDGVFPARSAAAADVGTASGLASGFTSGVADGARQQAAPQTEIPLAVVDHAVDQVGEPTDAHRQYAGELLSQIDQNIIDAVRDPYGCRAVIFALLLDGDMQVRAAQFASLDKLAKQDVVELTRRLVPAIVATDDRARLPIVDLSLPALRSMTPPQFKEFSDCLRALVAADAKLSLFEWTLARVLVRHLQPQFEPVRSPRVRYYGLQKLGQQCSVLLSTLAHAAGGDEHAADAFADAASQMPELNLSLVAREQCNLNRLDEVLNTLATVAAKHRGRLIDACAAAICADGHVNIKEAELLRGVSDLLDCPMPPLLAGQKV